MCVPSGVYLAVVTSNTVVSYFAAIALVFSLAKFFPMA